MSPHILRCFDPETVSQKGHYSPFFRHWCDLGYLPFIEGNQKFRLENQMVCAIPFGKLQETRAFAEEDALFHSLVSLWRVKFKCLMFTHNFFTCLKLIIPDLLILLLCQQLSWASDMRESLQIAETPKDVNSSKQLIQEHEEKWDDIQTHNDR